MQPPWLLLKMRHRADLAVDQGVYVSWTPSAWR